MGIFNNYSLAEYIKLFKNNGFEVKLQGNDSYLATNGTITIAFTYNNYVHESNVAAVAVVAPLEEVKEFLKDEKYGGHYMFSAWMNGWLPFRVGSICNHDHSYLEIKEALERMK